MPTEKLLISVFIPTYNGEEYIERTVRMVLEQELPEGFVLELLVTDSGSTDNTVTILKSFGNQIVFDEIPNSEFGHGTTRQRAAKKASGKYIAFLTQDATPVDKRWLINLIEPFLLSEKIGCVFGRQIPRPAATPTIKREVATTFAGFGAPDAIVIHRTLSLVDSKPAEPINAFFSDVNSAVRRDLLISEVPFRDVKYAEDHLLAEDMQAKGYLKAYSPLGAVWHSNKYTAREYYARKFDEFIGLQESINLKLVPSLRELLLAWIRPTLHDWRFTLKDSAYSWKLKLKGFLQSPLYNLANYAGKYKAAKYLNDSATRERISLESRRRK